MTRPRLWVLISAVRLPRKALDCRLPGMANRGTPPRMSVLSNYRGVIARQLCGGEIASQNRPHHFGGRWPGSAPCDHLSAPPTRAVDTRSNQCFASKSGEGNRLRQTASLLRARVFLKSRCAAIARAHRLSALSSCLAFASIRAETALEGGSVEARCLRLRFRPPSLVPTYSHLAKTCVAFRRGHLLAASMM